MSSYRECSELCGLTKIESIVVAVETYALGRRDYVKFFCLNTPKEIVEMSYICDFNGGFLHSSYAPDLEYNIREGKSAIFLWGAERSQNGMCGLTEYDNFDKVVKTLDVVKEFNKRHKSIFPKRPLSLYGLSDKAIIIY